MGKFKPSGMGKIERFNFAVIIKNSIFNAFSLLLPTKHNYKPKI
jgi:hypothetical protein